jgi:hypothetical protein
MPLRVAHPVAPALLAVWLAIAGCAKGDGAATESEASPGTPAASSAPPEERRRKRPRKDRGSASMKLGGVEWEARTVRPRLSGATLTIAASRTEHLDGKMSRQELHLEIEDFKGPGDYVTDASGSRLVRVTLDVDKARAASADEAGTRKAASDLMSGAKLLMLPGAKVTITAADDAVVIGTFSWTPPPRSDQPALTEGSFRAVYRK